MVDPRYVSLAEVLIGHSCAVEPGERVLIEAFDVPEAFVRVLVRQVASSGGLPFLSQKSNALQRDLLLAASEEQMRLIGEHEAARMRDMDAYIGVRGKPNIAEWSDIPSEKTALYQKHWWAPVHRDLRVPNTKWVVLRWPDAAMAQLASMSTEAFEDFYFRVCTLDYAAMSRAMAPLQALMEATDRVRLVAPDTDLRFSIRGIPAVACDGKNNIPDGEVFTAPVRESVEGTIRFNTPTVYLGGVHDDVRLRFEKGRIVEASSTDTASLSKVLDTDEGARYAGEFAIGFHPHITRPMRDILFDEKIAGSLHFTPGACYDDASNGNRSEIHWDLVLRQTPEAGGGEIWFDDRLIRENGRFVLPELEALNPESLAG
ncbi:MAG: aminopeptidase [Holophagales bacterium]|nr:aminopeptidase [Holophagales bacterium]